MIFIGHISCSKDTQDLLSPDEKIKVRFNILEGKPNYTLFVGDKNPIKNASLGLKLDQNFNGKFKIVKSQTQEVMEDYEMTWWKNKQITNHYNETIFFLEEIGSNPKKIEIIFRVYNYGIAFRYHFPKQDQLKGFIIEEDLSEFAFTDNYTWWSANGEKENLGPLTLNEFDKTVFTPAVIKCSNDLYLGIHEAAIYDFANFKLKKGVNTNILQCELQGTSNAKTGMKTSWRTILIGKRPGDLVESNLLVNLNPTSKIKDQSWIKSGTSMWDWRVWGHTAPDGFVYGLNTISHKRFIDFAAQNNVDFLLMDADWYGPEFSKESDPTKSNLEIDIEENFSYANEKGIGIILYLNDVGANKFGLERVLKQFHDWGAAGVKYGFMRSNGQAKVLQTRKIVELCAKYKLMVNFHDNPIPPSGDERTWPNVFNREYCHSQADAKRSYFPETAVSSSFINMITGPLDYCSGWYGFNDSQVRPKVFNFIPGTVAAENAKLVVMFSGISVLADSPDNYTEKSDMFDFIKQLPNNFDEFKVLDGDIDTFITVGRRSGENWFIGSLSNREPRTINLKLDFLKPGVKYKAYLFEDAPESHYMENREAYQTNNVNVDSKSVLELKLAPGGGHAIRITPEI